MRQPFIYYQLLKYSGTGDNVLESAVEKLCACFSAFEGVSLPCQLHSLVQTCQVRYYAWKCGDASDLAHGGEGPSSTLRITSFP